MIKPQIAADITEDHNLSFVIPHMLTKRLQEIGAGKRVSVEIKEFKNRRSNKQNSYLFGVVYPMICQYIKETTGQEFTSEDLHERYKKKYLGYEVCEIKGMGDIVRVKSSTELDTEQFWQDLIEHICREWAELGLWIPLPNKDK